MSKPKVSIVSIAYNQEKYIAQALDSFIMQKTDFDFEIIIADDCSTDRTPEIISSYAKKYPKIKPILRKQNIGIQQNLYDALRKAKGDYIALCEGDDYWTDLEKLKLQVDFLDKHKDYSLCFHPVRVFYEDKTNEDSVTPATSDPKTFTTKNLLSKNFIQTNSVMYRRQKYNSMPEDILPLDWYLHLYHAQFGRIGFINKLMSAYRRHPGGVWWESSNKSIWKKYGITHLKLYSALLGLYGDNPEYADIVFRNADSAIRKIFEADDSKNNRLSKQVMAEFPDFSHHALAQSYENDQYKQRVLEQKEAKIYAHSKRVAEVEAEKAQILQSATFRAGNLALKLPRTIKKVVISTRKKINVSLILRDGTTFPKGTAYIRLIQPLTDPLIPRRISLKIYDADTIHPDENTAVCIVQRTVFENVRTAEKFVAAAKERGIKIVVDTDDAFDLISKSHPEYSAYKNRARALEYVISQADQIWFSTSKLAKQYTTDAKKIVLRNSLDPRLWKTLSSAKSLVPNKNEPLNLVYMGTKTHNDDFNLILPALDRLEAERPGSFRLTVVGITDSPIKRGWIKYQEPKSNYIDFVRSFIKYGPYDIGLAPLVDNEFNANKSDIKCLDYLACGILPIVSDLEPYSNPELDDLIVRVKNNTKAWAETLIEQADNKANIRNQRQIKYQRARHYILSQRSTKTTAHCMLREILNLTGN